MLLPWIESSFWGLLRFTSFTMLQRSQSTALGLRMNFTLTKGPVNSIRGLMYDGQCMRDAKAEELKFWKEVNK